MTIVPDFKKCPVCHKRYSWNPDVGRFFCPYCGGIGLKTAKDGIKNLFGKKNKKRSEEE